MDPRISLITLGVDDLERARRFYETGLGWHSSSSSTETVSFYQLGGIALALYPRHMLAQDISAPLPQTGSGSMTLAHNVRSRSEVDRILDQAVVAGALLLKAGHDTDWGGYVGYFSDPDGHLWEIAWNPGFILLDDGTLSLPQ